MAPSVTEQMEFRDQLIAAPLKRGAGFGLFRGAFNSAIN